MVNRSNFPNSVDQFSTMVDILASDKTNVQRYQTLLMQETRTTEEETELINLKNTLINKIISSEHVNFISDAITSMQDYYLNEVVAHLATLDVGALQTNLSNHTANTSNPHNVTKSQIGLGNVDNLQQATKTEFNNHVNNNTNPHNTTATQVGAYSKSEADTLLSGKVGANNGTRIEMLTGFFFTNGGSNQATADITFNRAFSTTPNVFSGNIIHVVSYGDVIYYPYIYNVTTTGFSCKIVATGNLGSATPENLIMNFLVIGS